MKNNSLPRCTPESVGVSSDSIIKLMNAFKERNIENHSFMLLRHGKVFGEAWAYPFAPQIPHALYSFSKSFSATAIGFAIDEKITVPETGKPLALDTRLRDIFPEKFVAKKVPHKWDTEITIGRMLKMQSGKKINLLADKAKIDWIEDYINAPFSAKPGTFWNYCNENSFMLCAVIHRLTGETVREYLKERLFKPLGITENPMWETNRDGIEAGGWGLYLPTEDLAKFMQCYLDGGKFGGKQVIPEWWVKAAGSIQVDNGIEIQPDNKAGYGYHFWMTGYAPGYRADGMFSQHGIVLPDYDAVIITTSGCPVEQKNLDAIWSVFPEAFGDEPLPENKEAYNSALEAEKNYALPCLPRSERPKDLEELIDGKTYRLDKKVVGNVAGFPAGMLAMPITFMSTVSTGNIDKMRIVFKENKLFLMWTEVKGEVKECIPAGLDGKYRYGKIKLGPVPFTTASIACWNDDGSLSISVRPLESVSARTLRIFISETGDRIKVKLGETPSVSEMSEFLLKSFEVMMQNKLIVGAAAGAFKVLPPVLDPTLYGKEIK